MRPLSFVLASLWALTLSTPALAADVDAGDPFGTLPLVDEVDVSNAADAHPFHEDPAGASRVMDLLGRKARAMSIADSAQVFAYKLGAGKGLVPGEAYLLAVDYPEDTGRQIVLINRGADTTRTIATGQTIGDARESYTYPAPESLKYPLTGKWQTFRSLFFLHDQFQGLTGGRDSDQLVFPDNPADGFWVIVGQFRKKDSPLDAGAAVARIRLFRVPSLDALAVDLHFPPADLPRRHVFWREEMADLIIGAASPSKRGVADSVRWYEDKMRLAKFLGINTFTKDLLEFGHNQFWDSAPGGGDAWFYSSNQPQLWEKTLAKAAAHGLDVLPYYEYAGALGSGVNGTASYGYQHHCRPLGDRSNNAYTDVWWSESACVDVSDPAALDDVKKLLDITITRFKTTVPFAGAWFRTRFSNWPVSFADETLARFGAQANGGTAPTRDQLKADAALLGRYYAWYFEKRRDYLVAIRDHLRANVSPQAAVLFTPYVEEALHVPTYADWATPTDDLTAMNAVNGSAPWQWRFAPVDWATYVKDGKFAEMTLRMTPPSAETLQNHWPETDHSAPPADPSTYANVDDVFPTMPFSRLFTVSSAAQLDRFRVKSGLALVRHFNLNEEDGQNSMSQEGPMSKKVGYFVSDVDRAGPYSMLAEARAVAYGDPRYIGYLAAHSFSRGFPEYTRSFNAAYLALPALPSTPLPGAASDAEVIVREIRTPTHGTYYAVVNVGLTDKKDVNVSLPAEGVLTDLAAAKGLTRTGGAVTLSFFPGQLYALHVGDEALPGADGGVPDDAGTAPVEAVDAGQPPSDAVRGQCGCSTGGVDGLVLAALLALHALRRRR